ncbi:trypsin, alkaline C [Plutella xylostella]|uniref:trypsin, alkaline C n=1 Tax=Plutella xylostella TaxID=51655 RepID=UPI002032DAA5|nr:trypsin, alkaline C [Plutella xylostella]
MATWALLLLTASATAVVASNRIVGGADASIETYPSIVQVEHLDYYSIWSQGCGGSILTPTNVLTAAHCIYGPPMRIRAGSSYRESGGTVINVESYIMHPDFNKLEFLDADVALLRLEQALVYGPGIQPIAIYAQGVEVPDNSAVVHAGWGQTQSNGVPSPILQDVTVYTVNQEECARRQATQYLTVTDNMMCAGILDVGGKDACQQDSGGPLYHGDILVGVISWGIGCAQPEYPGVSAKVSAFTEWIVANAV